MASSTTAAAVLAAVARSVEEHLRWVTSEPDGRAGVVAVVQTFTGDLRRYVHVHALVPDAVREYLIAHDLLDPAVLR